MKVADMKKALQNKKNRNEKIASKDLLSTGSTLLNLACSGRARGGFAKGKYYFIVGDSSSGKTFYSLTCLAEASINKHFKHYRYIFDNAEDGALMDIKKFFGSDVSEKIEPPAWDENDRPVFSETVEDFYYHFDDAVQDERPFIYILDSMDALTDKAADAKFKDTKEAHRKGKKVSGSYGTGKPSVNSENLRRCLKHLKRTGSILIVLSQTRDNIGFGAKFNPKTRSGGHALTFYATLEIWTSVRKKITRDIRGKTRQIGMLSRAKVKKNRMTGQDHTIDVPFYHSYGFDDMGSCIDYLIEEGTWSMSGKKINAPEFDFKGSRTKLIAKIEEENLLRDLRDLVEVTWKEIQEACRLDRRPRYE